MIQEIYPCLWFTNQAKAAADFSHCSAQNGRDPEKFKVSYAYTALDLARKFNKSRELIKLLENAN